MAVSSMIERLWKLRAQDLESYPEFYNKISERQLRYLIVELVTLTPLSQKLIPKCEEVPSRRVPYIKTSPLNLVEGFVRGSRISLPALGE